MRLARLRWFGRVQRRVKWIHWERDGAPQRQDLVDAKSEIQDSALSLINAQTHSECAKPL